jgi:hypothetical protein
MASKTSAPTYPDGYMSATTPAQAARALNMPGKSYRDVLRSQLGVYVSRGGVFDDDAKVRAFDIITARKAKRTAEATTA